VLGYCGNSGRAPRPHVHFQLQTTAIPGSATLPCRFSDLIVRGEDKAARFEAEYVPCTGETVETLVADYALGALFDLPLGTTLTYRLDGELEQVVNELDIWGRSVLRSVERGTELVILRSENRFGCGELRGDLNSVLTLLRFALADVPLERRPELTFRSKASPCWLDGSGRRLWWELTVPIFGTRSIALESRLEVGHHGLAVIGRSLQCSSDGVPLVQTLAVLDGALGPRTLEVTTQSGVRKAELVIHASSPDPVRELATISSLPAAGPA
jgi:hypothetical protein